MHSVPLPRPAVLPVLYIGSDLSPADHASLRAHNIGTIVADDAGRARRLLAHFRVAAVVFAVPDLRGLRDLALLRIPVVVLAARDAGCDDDNVTILGRGTDLEELAAVIHGVVKRQPRSVAA